MTRPEPTMYTLRIDDSGDDLLMPSDDNGMTDAGGMIFSTLRGAQAMQSHQLDTYEVKTVIVQLHVTIE